jgi:hypothetical protein
MESAPYQFNPHPPLTLLKMESALYPFSLLDYFLYLGIFSSYVQPLNLELSRIFVFNKNHVGCLNAIFK